MLQRHVQCAYLFLRFHCFLLSLCLLANGSAAPELAAHNCVAHDHNQHRYAVCKHQKHNVIAAKHTHQQNEFNIN